MTALGALKSVTSALTQAGIVEPLAKAKVIVAHALDIEFGDIHTFGDITAQTAHDIARMTQRCADGEPPEYVTGKAYFRHVVLDVTPSVLIPRQETELVVQHAIDLIVKNGYKTALDMCTGSGCIAVSLATETGVTVDAADISKVALNIAKRNAVANGADIRFFRSDMFDGIGGAYDIIVSNPPYVAENEYETLDLSVRTYEPRLALAAGDGLAFYRVIADKAAQHIKNGGALVLEIGITQGKDVAAMLSQSGFCDVQIHNDYTARDRIVTARRP